MSEKKGKSSFSSQNSKNEKKDQTAFFKKMIRCFSKRKNSSSLSNSKKQDFSPNNIYEIDNFNFWYNKNHQILFNINLKIKRHKVTAFIGPSGCGKSTLLKCLNRMNDFEQHKITTGNIYFTDGTNIKSRTIDQVELSTKVGMIFQKYCPFPFSIYDNIAFGLRNHKINNEETIKKIVLQSLKDVALYDEVKMKLNESALGLSGGQQQRLCIARAIALSPEVLLMDEPTSGLDPISTAKIENLILQLKEKYTIILVTHSMSQAQRVSDEIVFFNQGKIIECGKTKQIFMSPQKKLTQNYINGKI